MPDFFLSRAFGRANPRHWRTLLGSRFPDRKQRCRPSFRGAFLSHQRGRGDVARARLALDRAVQLVDQLPALQVERLGDRDRLVLTGADALEGGFRSIAGRPAFGPSPGDAGRGKRRAHEVEIDVVDRQCMRPLSPYFWSRLVVSGPMRVEVSAIGVSTYSSTVPPIFSTVSLMRSALSMAIW
jgi:hypothetical protein